MRPNPEKCAFRIIVNKTLGFYLKKRGIEENSNKYRAVVKTVAPMKKEVIKLNEILMALNMFISISTQHVLPFYKLLRKESHIE